MALLSRKVDYALLILSYLRHTPEGGCARAIADSFGLSRAFVANILKTLCSKGFVQSERGKNGGYTLLKAPAEITLVDLIDALEGPVHLTECCGEPAEQSCTVLEGCPIRGSVVEAHRRIRSALAGVTLAQLLQNPAAPVSASVELEVSRCQK
jgi:Rrf2 family protein